MVETTSMQQIKRIGPQSAIIRILELIVRNGRYLRLDGF